MKIEEITTIINETIEETKADLEKTGHFIQSVIDISLQVMAALQSVAFQIERTRALEPTIENEVKAQVIDKIVKHEGLLKE
jgi:high-affinity nickel permease